MIERTTKEIVCEEYKFRMIHRDKQSNNSKDDFNNYRKLVWVLKSEYDEEIRKLCDEFADLIADKRELIGLVLKLRNENIDLQNKLGGE